MKNTPTLNELMSPDGFDCTTNRYEYHRNRIARETTIHLESWEITALAMEAEQCERRAAEYYIPETIEDLPF